MTSSFCGSARSGTMRVASRANHPAKGTKISVLAVAQIVAASAIWRGTSSASLSTRCRCAAAGDTASAIDASAPMNGGHSAAPSSLNSTCTAAARSAPGALPMPASTAVIPVPIVAPNRIAIPAGSDSSPCVAMTTARPIVADDDCTSAVNRAPASMPSTGFVSDCSSSAKRWSVRSGAIAWPISPMP